MRSGSTTDFAVSVSGPLCLISLSHDAAPEGAVVVVLAPGFVVDVPAFVVVVLGSVAGGAVVVDGSAANRATIGAVAIVRPAALPDVEVAACVVVEAVTRLLPGVMGNERSADAESFGAAGSGLLEEPQYTRPASFRGWEVPEVLRSGDHGRIARWRLAQSLHRTRQARPDLLEARGGLSEDEERLLEEVDPVAYP